MQALNRDVLYGRSWHQRKAFVNQLTKNLHVKQANRSIQSIVLIMGVQVASNSTGKDFCIRQGAFWHACRATITFPGQRQLEIPAVVGPAIGG